MENSAFLEHLLIANKPIGTLIGILKEDNLKFFHIKVLNRITEILVDGYVVQESEKRPFTEAILDLEDNVEQCQNILKLLWKKKVTIPEEKKASSVTSAEVWLPEIVPDGDLQEERPQTPTDQPVCVDTSKQNEESQDAQDDNSEIDQWDAQENDPLSEIPEGSTDFATDAADYNDSKCDETSNASRRSPSEAGSFNDPGSDSDWEKEYRKSPKKTRKEPGLNSSRTRVLRNRKVNVTDSEDNESESSKKSASNSKSSSKQTTATNPDVKKMSLPTALVFGYVLHTEDSSVKNALLKTLTRSKTAPLAHAKKLIAECGENPTSGKYFGVNFIKLFSEKYPEYLVTIYNKYTDSSSIIYKTPKTQLNADKEINIFFDTEENDYFCIKDKKSFFNDIQKKVSGLKTNQLKCLINDTIEHLFVNDRESLSTNSTVLASEAKRHDQTSRQMNLCNNEESVSLIDDVPDHTNNCVENSDNCEVLPNITTEKPKGASDMSNEEQIRKFNIVWHRIKTKEKENNWKKPKKVYPIVISNTKPCPNNITIEEFKRTKRDSIIDPDVKFWSIAIALYIGKTIQNENEYKRIQTIASLNRYQSKPKLIKEVIDFVEECGGDVTSEEDLDVTFVELFNAKYPQYMVNIYNNLLDCKSFLYKTLRRDEDKDCKLIHIFFDVEDKHFFYIWDVKIFFNFYRLKCKICAANGPLHPHNCPLQANSAGDQSKESVKGIEKGKALAQAVPEVKRYKRFGTVDPYVKGWSLPIALIFGQILNLANENERITKLNDYTRNKSKLFNEARTLVKECRGNDKKESNFIKLFNAKYPEYTVTIYNKYTDSNSILYKSPKTHLKQDKVVHVFYDEEEKDFFCITDVTSFFDDVANQVAKLPTLLHKKLLMEVKGKDPQTISLNNLICNEGIELSDNEEMNENNQSNQNTSRRSSSTVTQSDSEEQEKNPVIEKRNNEDKSKEDCSVSKNKTVHESSDDSDDIHVRITKEPIASTSYTGFKNATNNVQQLPRRKKLYPITKRQGFAKRSCSVTMEEYKSLKKSNLIDHKVEKLSLPVALFFGMTLHLDDKIKQELLISSCKSKILRYAEMLIKDCGSNVRKEKNFDVTFIKLFEAKHSEYLVTVYDNLLDSKSILYKTSKPVMSTKKRISIFYDDEANNYFCLRNAAKFFSCSIQCEKCDALIDSYYDKEHEDCPMRGDSNIQDFEQQIEGHQIPQSVQVEAEEAMDIDVVTENSEETDEQLTNVQQHEEPMVLEEGSEVTPSLTVEMMSEIQDDPQWKEALEVAAKIEESGRRVTRSRTRQGKTEAPSEPVQSSKKQQDLPKNWEDSDEIEESSEDDYSADGSEYEPEPEKQSEDEDEEQNKQVKKVRKKSPTPQISVEHFRQPEQSKPIEIHKEPEQTVHQADNQTEKAPAATERKLYFTSRLSSGNRINAMVTATEFIKNKKYSVMDPNVRELSLPIALYFGKMLTIENESTVRKQMKCFVRGNMDELFGYALSLIEECGGDPTAGPDYGIDFLTLFNEQYPEYLVTVYDIVNDYKSNIYKTPRTEENVKKRINIIFNEEENTYVCITKLPGFFNSRYQCKYCDALTIAIEHARCPGKVDEESSRNTMLTKMLGKN